MTSAAARAIANGTAVADLNALCIAAVLVDCSSAVSRGSFAARENSEKTAISRAMMVKKVP